MYHKLGITVFALSVQVVTANLFAGPELPATRIPILGTIDTDDRCQVTQSELGQPPYLSVCRLRSYFTDKPNEHAHPGTGWYCSRRVIITAAHCLYKNGKNANRVFVRPAFDGLSKEPKFVVSDYEYHPDYFSDPVNYDIAAVFLSEQQANTHKALPIPPVVLDDTTLKRSKLTLAEFGIPPGWTVCTLNPTVIPMWKTTGSVWELTPKALYHDLDTGGDGASGSPMWIGRLDGSFAAIGMHTRGYALPPSGSTKKLNFGLRITKDMQTQIQKWIDAHP